jgi:SAM-dependent methyltransferase
LHSSAMRIGEKFLKLYRTPGMSRVLEIGSLDVNGSLRIHKPDNMSWIGVDIEVGHGVDVVVRPHARLPFPDNHFDLVVATSVFEHDTSFWKTMSEMSRVTSETGFIYVSAPSNGLVHRHPLDVYRFYPDAGIALVQIANESGKPEAFLSESFIANQDLPEGLWNDFVAVIGAGSKCSPPPAKIYESEQSTNVRNQSGFLEATTSAVPEHMQLALRFRDLEKDNEDLRHEIGVIQKSWSWILTRPLRILRKKIVAFQKVGTRRSNSEG